MKFYNYIENRMVAEVEGYEFAWEVYRKTCELAALLCETANLVDGEPGEAIESSDDWDEQPADLASAMGFDPYMGCFSDDYYGGHRIFFCTVGFVAPAPVPRAGFSRFNALQHKSLMI